MGLFNYFRELFYAPFKVFRELFSYLNVQRTSEGYRYEPFITEQEKSDFKKTLGESIISNFDIFYKPREILLSRKKNSGLVSVLSSA